MSDGIQEQRSGTQGLEIELQDPSHLFRHASEITKGNKNLSWFLHTTLFQAFTIWICIAYDLIILQRQKEDTCKEKSIFRWKRYKMEMVQAAENAVTISCE